MASIVVAGDTSGSITLAAPAIAGSNTLTLPTQTATLATLTTPSFATTIGVGGATPSTSGAGITFPATQSASTDANTLDDYEEGTWTPSVGGNATYSSRSGRYTRIGNAVTIFGQMTISSIGTGNPQAIGGLPFSSQSECCIPVDKSQNLSTSITWMALRVSGTELYAVTRTGASTSGNINALFMTNSTEMQFAGTYIIS